MNNESLTIKIKYKYDDTPRIKKITKGDWIDLCCAEDTIINKDEFKLINLGIAMELPAGYEAQIVPRSSTFKNYGIIMTNSIGIVDESYNGDTDYWRFPAYCLAPKNIEKNCTEIKKGDRICQFRIFEHMPNIVFEEVDHLNDTNRGGFGTTGK